MIRLASASSPQTMMWPDMAKTLLVPQRFLGVFLGEPGPVNLQSEIREIEAGHYDTTDQGWLGAARTGPLPVPGRHQHLRMLAGFDVRAEQQCRRTALIGTELQATGLPVVQPQFRAAHGVPCGLLTGKQGEEDRGAGGARAVVVRR